MDVNETMIMDDFVVVVDNENMRTILQFVADMTDLRRPTSLVIDLPGAPISLEDEEGVIAEFGKTPDEQEFMAMALSGTVHLSPIDPRTQTAAEPYPVDVVGKVRVVHEEP